LVESLEDQKISTTRDLAAAAVHCTLLLRALQFSSNSSNSISHLMPGGRFWIKSIVYLSSHAQEMLWPAEIASDASTRTAIACSPVDFLVACRPNVPAMIRFISVVRKQRFCLGVKSIHQKIDGQQEINLDRVENFVTSIISERFLNLRFSI
jgi:hypothetical protein